MSKIIDELALFFSIDTKLFHQYFAIGVKIIFVIILCKISLLLANRLIDKSFKLYPKLRKDPGKSNTMSGLLKSVVKYAFYIVAGISILNLLGIPTQPLLATAGLGGIAIGFGAQSLIKDVVTGFFILFEDQYSVGDFVTIGTLTGFVEDIGIRITKIRAFNGELHVLPNGEIKIVTNLSRSNMLAMVDVGVSYEAEAESALKVIAEAGEAYKLENEDKVIDHPEVLGIVRLDQAEMVIRTIIKCQPLMHWRVERGMRIKILEALKHEGIKMPYAGRIILQKELEI